jgi:hypothetical protein
MNENKEIYPRANYYFDKIRFTILEFLSQLNAISVYNPSISTRARGSAQGPICLGVGPWWVY